MGGDWIYREYKSVQVAGWFPAQCTTYLSSGKIYFQDTHIMNKEQQGHHQWQIFLFVCSTLQFLKNTEDAEDNVLFFKYDLKLLLLKNLKHLNIWEKLDIT